MAKQLMIRKLLLSWRLWWAVFIGAVASCSSGREPIQIGPPILRDGHPLPPPLTQVREEDFIVVEESQLGPTMRLGTEPFVDYISGAVQGVLFTRPKILFDGGDVLAFYGRTYSVNEPAPTTIRSEIHLRVNPGVSNEPPIRVWQSEPGINLWRFVILTDDCGNYYIVVEDQTGHYFFKTRDYRNWGPARRLTMLDLRYQRLGGGLRNEPCGRVTILGVDITNLPYTRLFMLLSRDGGETFEWKNLVHDPRVSLWGASTSRDGNGNLWHLQLVLDSPYSKLHLLRCGPDSEACVMVNDRVLDTERFTPTLDPSFLRVGLWVSPDAQKIVVSWHDLADRYIDRLRYAVAYSTDGGASFSEPVLISHIPYGWRQFHHLFQVKDDMVYFFYGDTCGHINRPRPPFTEDYRCHFWLRTLDIGTGAVSAPLRVTPIYKYRDPRYLSIVIVDKADLGVAPDGRIHIIWLGNPHEVWPSDLHSFDYFYVTGKLE